MQKYFMKYGFTLSLLLGIAFGMSSCVKNYNCRCEISYEGQPQLPKPSFKEYEIKDNAKNAKSLCQGASTTKTEMGITTTESCDLY